MVWLFAALVVLNVIAVLLKYSKLRPAGKAPDEPSEPADEPEPEPSAEQPAVRLYEQLPEKPEPSLSESTAKKSAGRYDRPTSGKCGGDGEAAWRDSGSSVRIIEGSGPVAGQYYENQMFCGYLIVDKEGYNAFREEYYDYNFDEPWEWEYYCYDDQIRRVIICGGITELGDHALTGLAALRELYVPDSVEKLSGDAFSMIDLTHLTVYIKNNAAAEKAFTDMGCTVCRIEGEYDPEAFAALPVIKAADDPLFVLWLEKLAQSLGGVLNTEAKEIIL